MSKELLSKSIAGEITLSNNPGSIMKKWREIFGMKQNQLASYIKISASVISDYEAGRRSPGIVFVKKFIDALMAYDSEHEHTIVKKFSTGRESAILSMREFLTPMKGKDFIRKIHGKVISNSSMLPSKIYGYTTIDSIKAIVEMNEEEFLSMYGLNTERALIFTKVQFGRSPMIAIKVTTPKPSMVVLHGLMPKNVDKLAIKIANIEKVPLVVSMEKDEESLIKSLETIEN